MVLKFRRFLGMILELKFNRNYLDRRVEGESMVKGN